MKNLFAFALMVCSVSDAAASEFRSVECEGHYSHHLQGVCVSHDLDQSIYWSFTTTLVRTDREGRLLKKVPVADHHGDLCFHDGKLYVAVNLGKFNDPQGNANSWIYVYDALTLQELARHEIQEVFHGAGGIGVRDGRFFVVGGLPDGVAENFIYEYDPQVKFIKKHVLASGHTNLGIQTATFADNQWWFGCYGKSKSETAPATPAILLRADASLTKVERFEFDCSLGIVSFGPDQFLVARGQSTKDRGHTGRLILAHSDQVHGLKLINN